MWKLNKPLPEAVCMLRSIVPAEDSAGGAWVAQATSLCRRAGCPVPQWQEAGRPCHPFQTGSQKAYGAGRLPVLPAGGRHALRPQEWLRRKMGTVRRSGPKLVSGETVSVAVRGRGEGAKKVSERDAGDRSGRAGRVRGNVFGITRGPAAERGGQFPTAVDWIEDEAAS